MTPQTIHILIYKNAIANVLRITQKLPLENVEQFEEMIKHNHNLINNNFWFLFSQLISQLTKMHEKTDTTMKNGNGIFKSYNTANRWTKTTRI